MPEAQGLQAQQLRAYIWKSQAPMLQIIHRYTSGTLIICANLLLAALLLYNIWVVVYRIYILTLPSMFIYAMHLVTHN